MSRREIVNLTREKIEIAQTIHKQLTIWNVIDKALSELHRRYDGFSLDACLVKAASVNTLYSTYVLAITQMAHHIHEVLQRSEFKVITEENGASDGNGATSTADQEATSRL